MTLTRSLPTQHATGLPLIDERRTTLGLFARNADGSARVGVLPAHLNPIVTGRASMGYDIAAFNAVTARTAAGAEQIANDGSVTIATTAAPGANSRIDVIWVRSQFVILGDANNDVVFGVTQGTAAFSPTKPAIPAGALELATATILSTATTTATAVITQTYQYTAAAGGVVLVRSDAERNAWAAPENAMVRVLSSGLEFRRVGTDWASTPGAHAEYTGTALVANGASANVPMMAVDASRTTDSSFATPVAGGFTLKPGVYMITPSTTIGGVPATGRCFIDIVADGITERVAWAAAPENILAGTGQVRASADLTVTITLFQTSGADRNMPTRVKITKVG